MIGYGRRGLDLDSIRDEKLPREVEKVAERDRRRVVELASRVRIAQRWPVSVAQSAGLHERVTVPPPQVDDESSTVGDEGRHFAFFLKILRTSFFRALPDTVARAFR